MWVGKLVTQNSAPAEDTFRMSEDLEAVSARDADERDAGLVGEAHGQRGQGGDRDYGGRAEHRCLLHQFDLNAAWIAAEDPRPR